MRDAFPCGSWTVFSWVLPCQWFPTDGFYIPQGRYSRPKGKREILTVMRCYVNGPGASPLAERNRKPINLHNQPHDPEFVLTARPFHVRILMVLRLGITACVPQSDSRMEMKTETIVETIPTGDHSRLLLVNCCDSDGARTELRQQNYGGDRVGWFTQSSITVPAESISLLRAGLGIASAMPEMVSARKISRVPAPSRKRGMEAPALRVYHAESA